MILIAYVYINSTWENVNLEFVLFWHVLFHLLHQCLLTLPRMCHVFLFLGFWLKPFLCIDSFLTCSQQLSFKFYSNFTSLWLLPPLFHSSVIFPSLNSKYLSVIWKSFMLYAVIACLLHSFNILFCVCSSSFLDMFCMYFQPKGRKHPFY